MVLGCFGTKWKPRALGLAGWGHGTAFSLRAHGDRGKQPLRIPLLWFRANAAAPFSKNNFRHLWRTAGFRPNSSHGPDAGVFSTRRLRGMATFSSAVQFFGAFSRKILFLVEISGRH